MHRSSLNYIDPSINKTRCCRIIPDFGNCTDVEIAKTISIDTKNGPLKLCLSIFPKGANEHCKDYVSIYLTLLTETTTDIDVKSEFSITRKHVYKSNNIYGPIKSHGCDNFIKREVLLNKANNLLHGCTLIIMCNIQINDLGYTRKNVLATLSQDLENMFITAKYSDVEFDVNGHKIAAHKNILSARNQVFSVMFEHDMKEAQTNCVVVTDIDPGVFKEMLLFIYSGKAPNLNEMLPDLLAAADKYDVEDLKHMCEQSLSRNLCVATAAETLTLADLYSCQQLKAQAIDFINANAMDVTETEAWLNMVKTHSHLTAELYRAMAMHQIRYVYSNAQ